MSIPTKFAGWRGGNYLAAYDTTNQPITASGEVFAWNYNTVELSKNISIVDTSKITFNKAGIYNIQFSAQIVNSNASSTQVYVWPRLNGVNIPYSNTKYTLQGSGEAEVVVLNYVLDLNKDDYVQVCWSDSDTVSLLAELSSASPDKPAIPSIILTVWQIN